MSVTVVLSTPELSPDRLHRLTTDFCRTVNDETDLEAAVVESPPRPGAKGDPVTIGAIALAVVSSGAAAKLFDVFRTYFERNKGLEIALERDDGKKLTVRAENLSGDRMGETLELVRGFLGPAP